MGPTQSTVGRRVGATVGRGGGETRGAEEGGVWGAGCWALTGTSMNLSTDSSETLQKGAAVPSADSHHKFPAAMHSPQPVQGRAHMVLHALHSALSGTVKRMTSAAAIPPTARRKKRSDARFM